jgi:hypothetical protein
VQLLQAAAACCKQTLRQAVAQGGHTSAPLPLLCHLPAAQQLSGDAVVQLLLSAVAAAPGRDAACIYWLCRLLAVQQLTTGHVAQLLLTALQHCEPAASEAAAWHAICLQVLNFKQCPAARQLSTGSVAQLLEAA